MCRSDHICGISTFSGKGRNGALQAHAKFGRVTSWFDAHRYCNRLHRPLRTAETGCQAGRWYNLPGWKHLERQKEQLTKMCKIVISKTKLSPTRKKFAVCKVVQKGDWTGLLDYEKVPLLPANKKRNAVKVLDVKSVEHKEQKRKLLLTEDGTVYKVKRSKLENKAEQYV